MFWLAFAETLVLATEFALITAVLKVKAGHGLGQVFAATVSANLGSFMHLSHVDVYSLGRRIARRGIWPCVSPACHNGKFRANFG